MKRLLTILLLFVFSYVYSFEITVYGRNSCGFTQLLRNNLANNSIPYTYCNIDSTGCLGQLFQVAIEFNLAVNGVVNLPVVLVISNGVRYGYTRPTIEQILKVTSSIEVEGGKLVYPNPVKDVINVSGDVKIYNAYSILLFTSHNRRLSIAGLPQGIYFVRVGNKTTKIIKH